MLYSATLGTRVLNISWEYMNNPAEIKVDPERMTVDEVEQQVFHVAKNEKLSLLLGLLREEAPESSLIFANTKAMCEELAYRLRENGYKAEYIIGDLPQKKRLRIIEDLKKGKTNLLVATDVAARGLHVNDLDLVINYDLPEDAESYVHRIGRTARAGKKGRAISLACERFVFSLEPIQEFIGMKIPAVHPGDADFAEDVTHGKSLSQLRRAHGGSAESRSGRIRRSSASHGGHGGHGGHSSGGRSSDAREKTRHSEKGHAEKARGEKTRGEKTRGEKPRGEKPHGGKPGPTKKKPAHAGAGKAAASSATGGGRGRGNGPAGGKKRSRGNGAERQAPKPGSETNREARLQYYREKYGEDFAFSEGRGSGAGATTTTSAKERKKDTKKGLFGRIRRALGGEG
jgi:ATP-dependent RNA helicase RhlB